MGLHSAMVWFRRVPFTCMIGLLLAASVMEATETPASFGVDLPIFTHLGFDGKDETMKMYGQVNPLQRLSGVQVTFGASGIWSFQKSGSRMILLGLNGSRSIAEGRVFFDGASGANLKREFNADITRGNAQMVTQLWLDYRQFKGAGLNQLRVLSLVTSLGAVSMHIDFPEEDTSSNGDGVEGGLGLLYEQTYLPGQVMHASALFMYRDMEFDNLFTKSSMNNDPFELQLRGGVEVYMDNGWNFSMDLLAAISEATNFNRYGLEIGLRYNY